MQIQLRETHMTPTPFLVFSGLSYLIPAYAAAEAGLPYSLASTLFLTATTVGFHGTRQDWLFQLDLLAILNYNICAIYNIYKVGPAAVLIWYVAVSYSVLSYFGGQRYNVLSFDPNWHIQMFFHSFIHFSTAYGAYYCFTQRSLRLEPRMLGSTGTPSVDA